LEADFIVAEREDDPLFTAGEAVLSLEAED
jgi:hypothetical protein